MVTLFYPLKNPQNSHEASSRWRHVASSPGTLLPPSLLQATSFFSTDVYAPEPCLGSPRRASRLLQLGFPS